MSNLHPLSTLVVLVAGLAWTGAAHAQDAAPPQDAARAAAPPEIYDTKADAKAQIADALRKAKYDNQRVLLMFGGNWCGWCHKLHGLFKKDKDIARTLLYEYRLVMIDIGRFDKNMDIAEKYGAELKKGGAPYLTVLDADGKPVANQETGPLESGDRHDSAKVLEFLRKHQAAPLDAQQVLKDGLARAAAEKKMLFLHFGAPWCGWCHRLEDWMAEPEMKALLSKDFIDVKIDQDRMTGAREVQGTFRKDDKGGIPWFAFVAADGKVLATSDGEKGNVGFPAQPAEIAHFEKILAATKKNLTDADIRALCKRLADLEAERERAAKR